VFDEIGDMPLHPLVTHAPVIGIPLSLLLALLFAIPRTRNWARWPLVLTVLGSTATVYVSRESGEALQLALNIQPGIPVGDLIAKHSRLADQLFYIMIGYSVIAIVAAFLVGRRTVAASDAGDAVKATKPRTGALGIVLLLLLLAAAVVATLWTVRVGDIGARAVWNPTGTGLLGLLGLG
jgi:hypothetical protein